MISFTSPAMLARLATTLIGFWLMASPDVLGYEDSAAASHHIIGPLVVSLAVMAIWEVMDPVRLGNLLLGALLLIEPAIVGMPVTAALSSVTSGVAILALTLPRGRPLQDWGGGWRELAHWKRNARDLE